MAICGVADLRDDLDAMDALKKCIQNGDARMLNLDDMVVVLTEDRESPDLRTLLKFAYPALTDYDNHNLLPVIKASDIYPRIENCLSEKLFPYQQKAVDWMVQREQKNLEVLLFWERLDNDKYINRLTGCISSSAPSLTHIPPIGGLLLDEMGLGKSVEIIALILSNPFKETNPHNLSALTESPCTLIISPSSIINQWAKEIELHAPQLRVLMIETSTKNLNCATFGIDCEYDVVLASYDVLRAEVYRARDLPDRPRRYAAKYERPQSFFKGISWWRVCVDEAQMIEGFNSLIIEMTRKLSCRHKWCITGTPIGKNGFNDIFGLIAFLGYYDYLKSWQVLAHLVQTDPKSWMNYLVKHLCHIAYRNTKESVSDQVVLPPQQRIDHFLKLEKVEQHRYDLLEDECKRAVKEAKKAAAERDADNDAAGVTLRSWVLRLSVHPQIGIHNRDDLGSELKSITQVLDTMIEQTKHQAFSTERYHFTIILQIAQTFELEEKWVDALNIYEKNILQLQRQKQKIEELICSGKDAGAPGIDFWQTALYHWQRVEHQYLFFIANTFHRLADERENDQYDRAETLRKKILENTNEKVIVQQERLKDHVNNVSNDIFNNEPVGSNNALCKSRGGSGMYIPEFENLRGGIRSSLIFDRFAELSETLNDHWDLIDSMRDELLKILMTPVAIEETVTGDEYEDGLVSQNRGALLLDVYSQGLRDRHELLTGNRSLILGSMKGASREETQLWDTLTKLRLPAKHDCFARAITNLRKAGIAAESNQIFQEDELCRVGVLEFKKVAERQGINLALLDRERDVFGRVFNARIAYFKQLQELSDDVVEAEKPLNRDIEASRKQLMEKDLATSLKLVSAEGKLRYLNTLVQENQADADETTKRKRLALADCGICKGPLECGVMLPCAHLFCENCVTGWIKVHRKCPLDRTSTTVADIQRILLDTDSIKERRLTNLDSPQDRETNDEASVAIKAMQMSGSFGTKLDQIVKHVLYLRSKDPRVQVIVFSQWIQVLAILTDAFTANNLRSVSLAEHGAHRRKAIAQFTNDKAITAFMLNATSQSAGLTLTMATHCFIVEPLMNQKLEMQATSRIHRIGQTKPTFVHRYIIEGTIEEQIYNISKVRRSSQNWDDGLHSKSLRQEEVVSWKDLQELLH